jgi:hypothetical protein
VFCADRHLYSGHSDIVAPFLDRRNGRWYLFTCRKGDPLTAPRIAVFDSRGERVRGCLDEGHIDMGWVAQQDDESGPVAAAIRIGAKTCGPDGRFHYDRVEFVFDALTGGRRTLPVSP